MKTNTILNATLAACVVGSSWLAAVSLGVPMFGWVALIPAVVVTVTALANLALDATSDSAE